MPYYVALFPLRTLNDLRSPQFSQLIHVLGPKLQRLSIASDFEYIQLLDFEYTQVASKERQKRKQICKRIGVLTSEGGRSVGLSK